MEGYLRTKCSWSAFYGFSSGHRHSRAHASRTTANVQLTVKGHFCFCQLYMKITTICTDSFDTFFLSSCPKCGDCCRVLCSGDENDAIRAASA